MTTRKTHRYSNQIADFQNGLILSLWVLLQYFVEKTIGEDLFGSFHLLIVIASIVILAFLFLQVSKFTGYQRFPVYSDSLPGLIIQAMMVFAGLLTGSAIILLLAV